MNKRLNLALTYEQLSSMVDTSLLIELIAPVKEFESQIVQVIEEIDRSGYLMFVYGVSGAGKSTFLASLEWRKHIPISSIINIDASKCGDPRDPRKKLRNLYFELTAIGDEILSRRDNDLEYRTCVIVDYLESLKEEDPTDVVSFFRDLNGLLRRIPMLLVWPVTNKDDVTFMYNAASSFSSVMFHRRLPIMEFTGPPIKDYSSIAQKTIAILNDGRTFYDFQLDESDFARALDIIRQKPLEERTIREYLQTVKDIWEEKTNYVEEVKRRIPGETEIWFVVCYPEAERVVAQFSKRLPDSVEENWNVNYSKLAEYVTGQDVAKWPTEPVSRLAMALSGVLKTKIMFMPTNAFVICALSYAEDAGIDLSRGVFEKMGVQSHWFVKSRAPLTLEKTPLYRQLIDEIGSKSRGGMAADALEKARKPFEYFNHMISRKGEHTGSDKPFNRAVALALQDTLKKNGESGLKIEPEVVHPWLNIVPDILITTPSQKYICVEFHYTTNSQPNRLAKYCLSKLDQYMRQIEYNERRPRLL